MANGMTPEAAPYRAQTVPWYIWVSVVAVTATSVGLYWDISWHMSIGRDTFWTPAHLGILFAAIVAGLSSVFLIFSTTFGKDRKQRGASVKMWGFYGPVGAFVSLCGGHDDIWLVSFMDYDLGYFDLETRVLEPLENPFGPKVLPM
jgi:hypothetical protein